MDPDADYVVRRFGFFCSANPFLHQQDFQGHTYPGAGHFHKPSVVELAVVHKAELDAELSVLDDDTRRTNVGLKNDDVDADNKEELGEDEEDNDDKMPQVKDNN